MFVALQSSLAQPATVHAIPFASVGNAVELVLAATGDAAPDPEVRVVVANRPAWLAFHAPEVAPAAPNEGGVPVARLVFDVAREAPVGETAEVVFEVRSGGAVLTTHTVWLQIAPPAELALDAPYPNPSRGAVTVPFVVPSDGPARLAAYDVLGREVAVLADGAHEAGAHEARLPTGSLPPGVYVVRLVAGDETRVQRLTVVR